MAIRARVLAHPLVLALLGLWAVNDQLLKELAPGPVTGKLSDIAGLVVFPLLVGTLWPGPHPWRLGAASTAIGFAAVNLSPFVATSADDLLSALVGPSTLTPDPTDLVFLPCVLVALGVARRPPSRRWASGVGRLALVAGLATTVATSRIDEGTPHVLGVEGATNGVAIGISPLRDDVEPPGCTDVWTSADGRQWVRQPARSNCPREPRRPATPPPPVSAHRACMADGLRCFRTSDLVVQRSLDGGDTWVAAWRWPTDRARFDGRWCPLGCAYENRGPHAIAVATLSRVETVVVAMGHEGVLLSTDGVVWEPVAPGPTGDATSLTGEGPLFPEHVVVVALAGVLLAATLQLGRLPEALRRRLPPDHPARRRHRWWLAGWALAVLTAAVIGGGAAFWRFSEGTIWHWHDALRTTLFVLAITAVVGLGVAYLGRRATMRLLRS